MSIPITIKAVKSQPGEGLAIEEVSLSTSLAPYEVLLKNRAVGLNPTDWKHSIGGMWGDAGFVVGCDGAGLTCSNYEGDVVAVGSEVKHVQVGDRVGAFLYGTQHESNGAFAEYARYNSPSVWKLPEGMSFAEAASITVPILTAAQSLYFRHDLPYPSTVKADTRPTENDRLKQLGCGRQVVRSRWPSMQTELDGHRFGTPDVELEHGSASDCVNTRGPNPDRPILANCNHKDKGRTQADPPLNLHSGCRRKRAARLTDLTARKGPTSKVGIGTHAGGESRALVDKNQSAKDTTHRMKGRMSGKMQQMPYEFPAVPVPFIPEDNARALAWNTHEQPALVDGWVEGKGSKCGYRTQKLRVGEGLEGVMEGLNIMKRGEYAAEKLVYNI
ncbi:GroES-like protein [Athelia psychrophila]|uniref:GroES-like protein n=1 Tax=Athelia psychrophila TaxID=1759441 RepID=A0A165YR03_9AGAM|nr:GroES-like protein [Fibularhizoctonia sp. CBS 109695]